MVFSYSEHIREQERETAEKMAGKDKITAERLLSLGVSPDIIEEVADLPISVIERIRENLSRKASSSDHSSSP